MINISENAKQWLLDGKPVDFRMKIETAGSSTILNRIVNGGFSDGSTGWNTSQVANFTVDSYAHFTCPTSLSALRQTFPTEAGHKYYVMIYAYADAIDSFEYGFSSSTGSSTIKKRLGTTPVKHSMIIEPQVSTDFVVGFTQKPTNTVHVDKALVVDLTEFFWGGDIPTVEELDEWMYDNDPITEWFEEYADYIPIIRPKHIVANSMVLDRNSITGANVEIGNAETSELLFTLDNSDGKYNNVMFQGGIINLNLIFGTEEYSFGKFVIDTQPKSAKKITIRAMDFMSRFNKPFSIPNSDKMILRELLNDVCSECVVPVQPEYLVINGFLNSESIVTVPVGEDITYHNVISWIAELAGSNAHIDHFGRLTFSWYDANSTPVVTIDPSTRFTYELEEYGVEISGIVYKDGSTDEPIIFGDDSYAITMEGNELISSEDSDFSTVMNNIMLKIAFHQFRPFKMDTFGLPFIEPQDVIEIITPDGETVYTFVTNHKYVINSKSTLLCKSDQPLIKRAAGASQMTASQKRIIQNLANQVASTKVTNLERELLGFNSMLSNSLGFYETIATDPVTGAKILYMHNLPQLEESMIIYKQASDGFGYTSNGWNDGNPTFETGVGADGTIVGNVLSTVGINAEWIKAGTIDAQIVKIKNIEIGGDTVYASGYDPSKIGIGGRNLLQDTEGTFEVIKTDTAGHNDAIHRQTINIPDGKEYILSFKAKASAPMVLRSYFYNPNTTTRAESSTGFISNEADGTADTTITTEWDSYWIKWNQSETVAPKTVIIARILDTFDNILLEIKEIKLEKGNIATDWTPAPEEIDAEFAKIRTNIRTDENGDLLINRENSPTFMKLDPEKLSFISNENKLPLASFGTKEMEITNAHVKQYLRIGSFEFVPSSDVNGDLTLKYIG